MNTIRIIGDFIQNQILGMKWLNQTIGKMLSSYGLDIESKAGASVQFFIYDTIKITILLCVLIYFISYIQSYFPPERSKRILGRFHEIGANCIAALLGTVTPFCSCSSIPLFIGFTGAGLPLGVTFSFLISSPMVDLGSLVLLMSIMGSKIAVIYVIVGLIIAVIGGTIIEKLHMEKYVEQYIKTVGNVDIDSPDLIKKIGFCMRGSKLPQHSRKCSLIFSLAWELGLLFITGFPKHGLKMCWEVITRSLLFLQRWLVFRCMRIFSVQYLLRRLFIQKVPNLVQF